MYFVEAWSVSIEEFQKCASAFNHGTPSVSIAKAFIESAVKHGNITSKLEAFMAISEMSWESVSIMLLAIPLPSIFCMLANCIPAHLKNI